MRKKTFQKLFPRYYCLLIMICKIMRFSKIIQKNDTNNQIFKIPVIPYEKFNKE